MKLRIRDNSIRLRLSQTEVESMGTTGLVSASVPFAGGEQLVYSVESSPACVETVAQFSAGQLLIRVPQSVVNEWVNSETVTIQSEQVLEDGNYLRIVVEKDFACLAPREGEDDSDMFPHPLEGKGKC